MRRRFAMLACTAAILLTTAAVSTLAGTAGGTVVVPPPRTAGITIGFGDSVAAGYGLSIDGQYNPGDLTDRFPGGNASCSETPDAYPCVLAHDVGDDSILNRNFAVQGAQSYQVLDQQIPRAARDMTPAERQSVNVVTLTVGMDDLDFASCLQNELTNVIPDPCLSGDSGDLSHLQISHQYQAGFTSGGTKYDGLDGLKSNLVRILHDLESLYPDAHIYVTSYYPAFAPPAGGQGCLPFWPDALLQEVKTLEGDLLDPLGALNPVGTAAKILAEIALYNANLPGWAASYQSRMVKIQGEVLDQLVADDMAAAKGSPRVSVVRITSLDGHGICSGQPLVFEPSINASLTVNLGAIAALGKLVLATTLPGPITVGVKFKPGLACPHPDPGSEARLPKPGSPGSVGAGWLSGVGPGVKVSGSFFSNCLPHPTVAGQRAIAGDVATVVAAVRRQQVIDQPPGVHGAAPGYGTPEQAVAGALTEELVNADLAGLCRYVVPAQQSACQTATLFGSGTTVTGGVRLSGEVVDGDRALVAAVGKICQSGGPTGASGNGCVENADPIYGLPGRSGFDAAYHAAVAAASSSGSGWSAFACLKVNGLWYLNIGL